MGDKKKKILLLSDDIRTNTGVATQSKELIWGTIDHYDWVQLAGKPIHQEAGKVLDMSELVKKDTKVEDAYLKLYPISGYGNEQVLFAIITIEKPDAILHFTDPRSWIWLYEIEHQIRDRIPLTYLNIWDDLPYPLWNKPYYNSCDALFAISKQTYNINKWVLGPENCIEIDGSFDKDGNLIKENVKNA